MWLLLFRTTKDIEVYQGAFASCAIDTHVVGGRAYFSQQEVIDLVNLLRVIEDPYDELALAGVLRSPWIGVDDEGLWQSAALHGLADGFWRDLATEGLSTRNRDRLERARRLLTSWREAKDRISIARLVDRVLDESGMEATAALMPLGDQKYANLRKLVRVASNFDAHGGWSLADFVHRIRSDLEGDAREELGVVSEEEGTAVRLMTIHQAKGLEFPIVVLPDLDRSNVNRSAAIGRDDALGLIPRPADNLDRDDLLRQAADGSEYGLSLGDAALHLLEHVRTRHEAYRLLYVAMTRARDHLVLSTTLLSHEGARSIFGTLLFSKFDRETGRSLSSTVDWPAARIHIAQSESLTEAGAVPSSRRLPAAWIAAARAIEQGLHGRCAPENSS
jgi:ATP-dependent helicase/nuclease subunit A